MTTFNYTDHKGKQQQGSFYQDWSEVPFSKFIKWQELIPQLAKIESKIKAHLKQIEELKEQYEKLYFSKQTEAAAKVLEQSTELVSKIEHIKYSEQFAKEIEGIALFCSLSAKDLNSLNCDTTDITDTAGLAFYKNQLYLLSKKPLPTQAADGKLIWQAKTDKEIEQLENKYRAIPFFSKMTSQAKQIKYSIAHGKASEYKIENIWNQSTYANYQFRQAAKSIVKEIETGQSWSSLPILISMLLVEKNVHSEILNRIQSGQDTKQYLEHYAAEYKKVHDRNYELFFCQKKQLSVADVLSIRNFFLRNLKKYQKPILKY